MGNCTVDFFCRPFALNSKDLKFKRINMSEKDTSQHIEEEFEGTTDEQNAETDFQHDADQWEEGIF